MRAVDHRMSRMERLSFFLPRAELTATDQETEHDHDCQEQPVVRRYI